MGTNFLCMTDKCWVYSANVFFSSEANGACMGFLIFAKLDSGNEMRPKLERGWFLLVVGLV